MAAARKRGRESLFLTVLFEHGPKASLREMVVGGQGIGQSPFALTAKEMQSVSDQSFW
jgi:hypothetical protein